MEEIQFEIICDMPFSEGQNYIVGYDTIGAGVRFDSFTQVCKDKEELEDEIYRVINEHDLEASEEITLEEQIVIAELRDTPNLNYREYTLEKKSK